MQGLEASFHSRSSINKVGAVIAGRQCRAKRGSAPVGVSESSVLLLHDISVSSAPPCSHQALSMRLDDAAEMGSRKSDKLMGRYRQHGLIVFVRNVTLSSNVSNIGDRLNIDDGHILNKLFDIGCIKLLKFSVHERS